MERFKRQDANAGAIADARGWTGLFNGFAGDSGRKESAIDFLPFPEEVKASTNELMPRTRRVLIKLIKKGKLPPKVVGVAMQLQEIRSILDS